MESAESAGRRMNLPLLMILLTDGRASDDRLSLMMAGWKMQAAAWCNSFAIGLDPDADEEELFLIGGDLQHYALIDEVRLDSFIVYSKQTKTVRRGKGWERGKDDHEYIDSFKSQ